MTRYVPDGEIPRKSQAIFALTRFLLPGIIRRFSFSRAHSIATMASLKTHVCCAILMSVVSLHSVPGTAQEPLSVDLSNSLSTNSEQVPAAGFSWGSPDTTEWNGSLNGHVDGFEPPWDQQSWFHSADRDGRHLGFGEPLTGTSWCNRPWHAGWMFGTLFGDHLTSGETHQGNDIVGGYRLGWDFDHYWGTEARFAFSNVDLFDVADPSAVRNVDNQYVDINLLYYPWGDSRWRPFASAGLGWAQFEFTPVDGQTIDKALFTLPIALGVKYFFQNWMALRLTASDTWAFGQGQLNTMHNVMLTADVEVHFGGRRPSYFPYSGSLAPW